MGVLGGSYGNLPGLDTAYSTYETSFGWGPYPRVVYILPKEVDANAVDARFTGTTWRLGAGLVMGVITTSGNYTNYSPTATDGSQIAAGVLMESYRRQDIFSGSNVAKQAAMMVAGPVRAAGLAGLDQKARYDLHASGFVFDDDPRGPVQWRQIEIAGNQTVTIPTPAVGATYQNATEFVVTSGGGAATFNLPTIAPGLRYKFYNANGQQLTVTATTNNVIAFNNTAATSLTFNSSNALVGGSMTLTAAFISGNTYKWMLNVDSAGANTITVS